MKIVKVIIILALMVIAYDYYRFRSSMSVVANYLISSNLVTYDSLQYHHLFQFLDKAQLRQDELSLEHHIRLLELERIVLDGEKK